MDDNSVKNTPGSARGAASDDQDTSSKPGMAGTAAEYGDTIKEMTSKINLACSASVRHLKPALAEMIKAGKQLAEAKRLVDGEFARFVETQLPFDLALAELLIRFSEVSRLKAEDLSAAVEVKMPVLLELFAQLSAMYMADKVPKGRPGPKKVTEKPSPEVQKETANTKLEPDVEQPASSDRRATRSTSNGNKAKSEEQSDVTLQPGLIPEEKQWIYHHSRKLYAQVMLGEVAQEDALRVATEESAGESQHNST